MDNSFVLCLAHSPHYMACLITCLLRTAHFAALLARWNIGNLINSALKNLSDFSSTFQLPARPPRDLCDTPALLLRHATSACLLLYSRDVLVIVLSLRIYAIEHSRRRGAWNRADSCSCCGAMMLLLLLLRKVRMVSGVVRIRSGQ